jgi:hypothetical protein
MKFKLAIVLTALLLATPVQAQQAELIFVGDNIITVDEATDGRELSSLDDLVELSANPLDIDPEMLRGVRVQATPRTGCRYSLPNRKSYPGLFGNRRESHSNPSAKTAGSGNTVRTHSQVSAIRGPVSITSKSVMSTSVALAVWSNTLDPIPRSAHWAVV